MNYALYNMKQTGTKSLGEFSEVTNLHEHLKSAINY